MLQQWLAANIIPENLAKDNGLQFIAEDFDIFTKHNGITHVKSALSHPACNSITKQFI